MGKDGNKCKNPSNSLVAATFEKAKAYVFAEPKIRDREVGGSNPLAPTMISTIYGCQYWRPHLLWSTRVIILEPRIQLARDFYFSTRTKPPLDGTVNSSFLPAERCIFSARNERLPPSPSAIRVPERPTSNTPRTSVSFFAIYTPYIPATYHRPSPRRAKTANLPG